MRSFPLTAPCLLQAETLYTQSVKCTDEMFHVALYQWMIDNELTDKLLQVVVRVGDPVAIGHLSGVFTAVYLLLDELTIPGGVPEAGRLLQCR